MPDFEVIEFEDEAAEADGITAVTGKALVVFRFGRGVAMVAQAGHVLTEMICGYGCSPDLENFALDGLEYQTPEDGVYICDIGLADGGPGDWPGSREVVVQLCGFKPVTQEEWGDHLGGQWPWEIETK